jgi:hypothetical protein
MGLLKWAGKTAYYTGKSAVRGAGRSIARDVRAPRLFDSAQECGGDDEMPSRKRLFRWRSRASSPEPSKWVDVVRKSDGLWDVQTHHSSGPHGLPVMWRSTSG